MESYNFTTGGRTITEKLRISSLILFSLLTVLSWIVWSSTKEDVEKKTETNVWLGIAIGSLVVVCIIVVMSLYVQKKL
jgi:uncharacterized membrane protein YidH (DUF202 family)